MSRPPSGDRVPAGFATGVSDQIRAKICRNCWWGMLSEFWRGETPPPMGGGGGNPESVQEDVRRDSDRSLDLIVEVEQWLVATNPFECHYRRMTVHDVQQRIPVSIRCEF